MPYNPGWQNNGGQARQNYNRQNANGSQRENTRERAAEPLAAEPLPKDYVNAAENVIMVIERWGKNNQITKTKLRNLMTLAINILNVEQLRTASELLPESIAAIQMMRIRVVYEAGRERMVDSFVREAKLIEYIKSIGSSREKLVNFAHYMEALVAYHRFYRLGNEG